jgi:inner membrane protein
VLFWDIGMAVLVFRVVYRDPKVDLRFLALGAVLPNLIDKPLTLLFPDIFPAGRTLAHTLVVSAAVMTVVLLATRRGRRRRAFMAVAIGMLLHLALDAVWTEPEVLFWPALGTGFPPDAGGGGWPSVVASLLTPWNWLLELVGLVYLVVLYRMAGLADPIARSALIRSGRLPG